MSGKKRSFCYLGGNISQDDATYLWREEFTELVADEPNIVIVNPCANEFNQKVRNVQKDDITGIEFMKEAMKLSQNILRPKDFQMIKMCNVAVMNIEIYNSEKPMIGTIQEFCWCHDIFNIPTIAICGPKKTWGTNPYVLHSWVGGICSAKVTSVKQAAEMLKTFFIDY